MPAEQPPKDPGPGKDVIPAMTEAERQERLEGIFKKARLLLRHGIRVGAPIQREGTVTATSNLSVTLRDGSTIRLIGTVTNHSGTDLFTGDMNSTVLRPGSQIESDRELNLQKNPPRTQDPPFNPMSDEDIRLWEQRLRAADEKLNPPPTPPKPEITAE